MSPNHGPASPLKKIKLKVTLEGEGQSLKRAGKELGSAVIAGKKVVVTSEAADFEKAIETIKRVGEAVREKPKDFK